MCANRQKEILTQNQMAILSGKKNSTQEAKRKTQTRARNNTKKVIEKLVSITKTCPDAIRDEDILSLVASKCNKTKAYSEPMAKALLKLVDSYLNQEAFTIPKEAWESDKLPPSFGVGRKRPPIGNKWIQIAGCLRSDDGAPLKKRLREKDAFSYQLLQIIHQSLKEITFMGITKDKTSTDEPIIIISSKGDRVNLNCSTLYFPRLISEKKITFVDAVKRLDSESSAGSIELNHFVLWRY